MALSCIFGTLQPMQPRPKPFALFFAGLPLPAKVLPLLLLLWLGACQPAQQQEKPKQTGVPAGTTPDVLDQEGSTPNTVNQEDQNGNPQDVPGQETPPADLAEGTFENLVEAYESPERANWQSPAALINRLMPLKGLTVADIGAGTGYFTFRLAARGARVVAIDIDPRFLAYITEQQKLQPLAIDTLISTRLTTPNQPGLKAEEADLVLMVNTYAFIQQRPAYLKALKKGMAKGGRLAIVDVKPQSPVPGSNEGPMPLPYGTVGRELTDAGFILIQGDSSSLKYQYIWLVSRP